MIKVRAPAVGRSVHLLDDEGNCRAAIITEMTDLPNGVMSLCVLMPACQSFLREVPFDFGDRTAGTWHWNEWPEHGFSRTRVSPEGKAS